jgi:hypothetical protein
MKFLKHIFIFSILFTALHGNAAVGCNIGNQIYPQATGGVNTTGYALFYNSSPITIRWYDQDPACGILSTKISMKSNAMDYCQIVGTNTWGIKYNFNPNDNSCLPLPLDDYIWLLVIGAGAIGWWFITPFQPNPLEKSS